jgi:pyruvate/2-oxoglutarate/acetoin dehydrogenase E1 component
MKSGDIVKIIKVVYPFIKKDLLGKTSKLIIKENGQYYLEDLKIYASKEILTTDLGYEIDTDNCSISLEYKESKLVTINDSIKLFIKKVEEGSEIEFDKYVKIYGERLLNMINKNNPLWKRAFKLLNK